MTSPETDRATELHEEIKQRIRVGLNAAMRSRTRLLAYALEPIEEALSLGIYRGAIVASLKAAGMEIDLGGFALVLHRLRKQARVVPQVASAPQPANQPLPHVPQQHVSPTVTHDRPYKTRDQIAEENPSLSRSEVRTRYSDQFVNANRFAEPPLIVQTQGKNVDS
jgi:hypothetical protein